MVPTHLLLLSKNVSHQIIVKKHIRRAITHIKSRAVEYKVKIARPATTVMQNADYNVLIFGRIIIFKRSLNALKELNATHK